VILVAGIADEGPVALVVDALERIGAHFQVFDQRHAADAEMTLDIGDAAAGGRVDGTLSMNGDTVRLGDVTGVYLRLIDEPVPAHASGESREAQLRSRRIHDLLFRFADIAACRVLNRPHDMASNTSKPYQSHIIRAAGFDIPETLITNDPAVAQEFAQRAWAEGGGVVYKSISGVRSIVQRLQQADFARLDRIRWCPTQFQREVPGSDLRVHVVGSSALAAAIASDATDYRYASRQTGVDAVITAADLDPELRGRCVRLARALDLPLAGIDLRRTPDGRYVCFEVNPSPAFSFYEQRAGVPIAEAIAWHLAGHAD
jgi:glutathione synthase/RimK-type ligase-like ATP-grasp enzyme